MCDFWLIALVRSKLEIIKKLQIRGKIVDLSYVKSEETYNQNVIDTN